LTTRSPSQIVSRITNSPIREFLFHNTDIRNLNSIAHFDAMFSCHRVDPTLSQQRRTTSITTSYQGQVFIANDQLKIHDSMMATGITKQAFRAYLDKHVFFWPTYSDCKRMYTSYVRRQPNNQRVIFKFRAFDLLLSNFSRTKICKYNSGSNPLNIHACSYRKGPHIFLPANDFEVVQRHDVPTSPTEIREVLVEGEVVNISRYIEKIYCPNINMLPVSWRGFYEHISAF
jgi:hypothetical protein